MRETEGWGCAVPRGKPLAGGSDGSTSSDLGVHTNSAWSQQSSLLKGLRALSPKGCWRPHKGKGSRCAREGARLGYHPPVHLSQRASCPGGLEGPRIGPGAQLPKVRNARCKWMRVGLISKNEHFPLLGLLAPSLSAASWRERPRRS